MIALLKKVLYFPVAGYFRFFANIRYLRWKPETIVVTGSNGKTTLFYLLKSQIGDRAKYTEHANSSFGIPFDILDLHRKSLQPREWFFLFFLAPFCAFKTPPQQKIYIVEADCDRPKEGEFLASFLHPEVVLWLNTARTHGMNFDSLVSQNKFGSVEEAIAYEYGFFPEYCQKLAIINGDSELQEKQLQRTSAEIFAVKRDKSLQEYKVSQDSTGFRIDGTDYSFPALLPEEIFYSISFCRKVAGYLNLPFDPSFKGLVLPPGRSSLFQGIKNTTIVDSSYNANLSSMISILGMYDKYPCEKKWVVLGDMMELGESEQEEHERLADSLAEMKLTGIVLIGQRVSKYTYPKLTRMLRDKILVNKFTNQKDALEYLINNITGDEGILFKGSQSMMLEGIIEVLLKNKEDSARLPRREKFWQRKRKEAGL